MRRFFTVVLFLCLQSIWVAADPLCSPLSYGGNAYSVYTVGATLYLKGFENNGHRYWAQTNSRFGQLTFFTGLASDGEAWVGYTRRVGWTTINRFSSSGGSSARFTCSRMTGC